jgi:serine/threonine-protein kinase
MPAPRGGASDDPVIEHSRFVIHREVARGGMSVIYAASDKILGHDVAIKASRGSEPTPAMRIVRESAMLALLDHPMILPLYFSGSSASGAPYLATRLVDGEDLETMLRREPGSWFAFLRHILDAADAMTYAHRRGVVHRDLKPANILVDRLGRTVIIDWGLAREVPGLSDSAQRPAVPLPSNLSITLPGSAVGTPGYWAPEQRVGDVVDPRSDIYSLGATMYRMVAGHAGHPVVPSGDELARTAPEASPQLRALISRATAINPSDRFPTMEAFANELRKALPRMTREREVLPRGRKARIAAVPVIAGVVLFAVVGAAAWQIVGGSRGGPALAGDSVWTGDVGRVELRVEGDKVRGLYGERGAVQGTLAGDTVKLRWCDPPRRGDVELTVGEDGSLRGPDGWNLTRSRDSVSARLNQWKWPCQ